MLYAASAFIMWGLFPIYFKTLSAIPALEMLAHRVVWSLIFVLIVLAWRRQWAWVLPVLTRPKVIAGFALSGLLLGVNWCIYIWAVNNDRIIDASFGYFINPLINVMLGFLILKERLRPLQWTAVGIAFLGVSWLTWASGQFPWIGLSLALTFAFYGLLRKTAVLGPLEGLALESMVLFIPGVLYLVWLAATGSMAFLQATPPLQMLVSAVGPITAIPLLLFTAGARRISLSLLGVMQYIGPTMQLLMGIFLYHEPFGPARMAGFALIWFALAIYTLEGMWKAWGRSRPASQPG